MSLFSLKFYLHLNKYSWRNFPHFYIGIFFEHSNNILKTYVFAFKMLVTLTAKRHFKMTSFILLITVKGNLTKLRNFYEF